MKLLSRKRSVTCLQTRVGIPSTVVKTCAGTLLLWLFSGIDILYAQQRIMPPRQRQEVMEKASALLDKETRVITSDFTQLYYPFAFPQPEVPETEDARESAAPPEPDRPADEEVLRALAERIRPTGTAVRGGRSFLIFSRGQVAEGGTIGLSYEGEQYHITVDSISLQNNSYRLRLNDATTMGSLGNQPSTGTIERN